MSAMPAGWTELSESPRVAALPPVDRVAAPGGSPGRAEGGAPLAVGAGPIAGGSILVVSFAFTVGILELLH